MLKRLNLIRTAVMGIFGTVAVWLNAAPTGTMTTVTPDGNCVVVRALSDNIIRVTNAPRGVKPSHTQAASMKAEKFNGKIVKNGSQIVMTLPSGLEVSLNTASGATSFTGGKERLLYDSGVRTTASDGRKSMSLVPAKGGSFYGAGERGHSFNIEGDTLVMYNRQNYGYGEGDPRINQMNICIPLFVSNQGYGVLFDDYAAAELVMSDPITYTTESDAPISYYFIYGADNLASVTREYTRLTGRQELPPFWSLGYITSKYGYHNESETRGVIDTLKNAGYSVDGVVLDLYWYGKETDMGRLEWNKEQWPDHRKMLADLKAQGVNTVLISQPYINKIGAIDNYNQLAEKGMLTHDAQGKINDVTTWVGEAGMFDVANPDTRRWLRERYRTLTDEGVGGWWGDLGEPEVHPETIVHANGEKARQYHNVYGNVWSSIIYDLYKDEYPDTRLMTLMRGGTTGLQRYSVFPWSTDVSRSWAGLQPQIKIMLNSGLSGLAYMSHDVGGFAIDKENPIDPELYVRWLQLGTFSPILRTHAQEFAEPYHYPEYADELLDLVKTRYRWLPYNYTLAYENASQGYPLVRPLNFDAHGATPYDSITDEYMWGSEVLVAPVLQQGARKRDIVVPDGTWIDYNNPDVTYHGPSKISYDAPLNVLPMLIRAGAFIPQADYEMDNTGDYDASRYTVLYYPRGNVTSDYVMFEDDRKSTSSLDNGEYALITFRGAASKSSITVDIDMSGDYPGMPAEKTITLVLPGIKSSNIKSVTENGRVRTITESADKYFTLTVTLTRNEPLKIGLSL